MARDPRFHTTQWSLVLQAAGTRSDADSRAALQKLCEAYWFPVFAFVRRSVGSTDEALDLTQGFFASLLETGTLGAADPGRGRFRSFLLATVKQFLSHEREKERAIKRGGGVGFIDIESVTAERLARHDHDSGSPERAFEREWALTALTRVKAKLAQEFSSAGKDEQFRLLSGHLSGDAAARPYAEIAGQLETSEAAVKMAVRRMRQRFGSILRDEIAQTVASPDEVAGEVRHLLGLL